MNQKLPNDSTKLAGRIYNTSDYQKKDALSSGFATTHEQASDTYIEGDITTSVDNNNDKKRK